MSDEAFEVFQVQCPCCRATLEIDPETQTVLSHEQPRPSASPASLQDAVRRLKQEQNTRDERFQKKVEEERQHGKSLEKRFEGLLRKAREDPAEDRFPRDIDLD
jgi:hypothetical protein